MWVQFGLCYGKRELVAPVTPVAGTVSATVAATISIRT
jgi:hypothetical protein